MSPPWAWTAWLLAFLCNAYEEQELEGGDARTVLHLHPALAPYKAAVLPLQKNKLGGLATQVYEQLVEVLHGGLRRDRLHRQALPPSGRNRHALLHHAWTSTPEATQTVTVRDRDTMEQERVAIADLRNYIEERLRF